MYQNNSFDLTLQTSYKLLSCTAFLTVLINDSHYTPVKLHNHKRGIHSKYYLEKNYISY